MGLSASMMPVLLIKAKLQNKEKCKRNVKTFICYSPKNPSENRVLLKIHYVQQVPVGFDSIVYVNADIVRDALLFLLSFISNFLCGKLREKKSFILKKNLRRKKQ